MQFSRDLCRYRKQASYIVLSYKSVLFKNPRPRTLTSSSCLKYLCSFQIYDRVRLYSNTSICLLAKAKKNNSKNESNEDSDNSVSLPDSNSIKKKMESTIEKFSKELSSIKVGRASPDMFNDIMVGSLGPLASVGQISLKTSANITISVYDPSLTKVVADAIEDCGLGLTPTVDGSVVSVFIPKPSKESREVLIKSTSRIGEKAKQDIRSIRKETLDLIKKCKGLVSDDDSKRASKDIEAITEKHVEKVSQLLSAKEKELLS